MGNGRGRLYTGATLPRKYLFWIFVVLLFFVSYLILKPYLVALVSAFVLAYLMRPLYKKLEARIGKVFAALLCVVIALVLIVAPLVFIVSTALQQALVYFSGSGNVFLTKFSAVLENVGIRMNIGDFIGGDSPIFSIFKSAVSQIPSILLALIVTLFGMYYFLVDWEGIEKKLRNFMPVRDKDKVVEDISSTTQVLVYGTFLIALLELVISAIGFYLLGIRFYLLLSAIVFVLAFVPLGPTIIWIPMMLWFFVKEQYALAFGTLIFGIILSVFIDTLLRAKFLGNKSRINPVIMLVGVFGGVSLFGVFGFIIGPLLLVYTLEILENLFEEV